MQPCLRHLANLGRTAFGRLPAGSRAPGGRLLSPAALAFVAAASFGRSEVEGVARPAELAPASVPGFGPVAPAAGPSAEAPRPARVSALRTLGLPRRPEPLSLALAFTPREGADAEATIPGAPSSRPPLRLRPGVSPAQAFAHELRKESQRYTERGLWANAAPELEEDDYVLESRSDAAERVLARAAEAGLGVVLESMARRTGEEGGGKSVGRTGNFSFRLDTTPGWSWKKRSATSTQRVDIPLTGQGIRWRTTRDFASHDKGIKHLSTGVSIDPWDESIRFGFTLGF